MTEIAAPRIERRRVADLKPYENNPRRLPAEAVEKLAGTIGGFGYRQPIVVGTDNVIVVGHTRHQALLQLGVEEVDVFVTDLPAELTREYRVVDNRLNELGQWDQDPLVMELREFDDGLRQEFFPHVDLEIDSINGAVRDVTDAGMAEATRKIENFKDKQTVHTTGVKCPACFERFEVSTATLPGLSRLDLEVLANRARAAG